MSGACALAHTPPPCARAARCPSPLREGRTLGKEKIRRPVSRVLCRPACAGRGGHSSGPIVADRFSRPTRSPQAGDGPTSKLARDPYSVLLLAGLAMRSLSPGTRCALTAPFHPYLLQGEGGLLSVALSLGSPPVGVTHRHVVVEPGLSSSLRPRPPGRLIRRGKAVKRPQESTFPPHQGRERNSAISRARVSPSAIPSTLSGRQCRWNARTTAVVSASNRPDGGRS